MKRFITLLLTSVCMLTLVSCNTDEIQSPGTLAEEAFDIVVSNTDWAEGSEIFLGALNINSMSENSILHLPIYKFDTLEELENFKRSFSKELDMEYGYDEIPSFNETTAKYNERFFEENTLMLVYVSANSGSYRYGVNSVFCDGDSFSIQIEQLNDPEVFTCDMTGWFITIAVSDAMIENCEEFDAYLANIETINSHNFQETEGKHEKCCNKSQIG